MLTLGSLARSVAALLVTLMMAGHAVAADYSLICANPGGEYNIVYSVGDKFAVINPDSSSTQLAVLALLNDDKMRLVILGRARPNSVSVLHLRPYLKIDIYDDGELVQTDACFKP